MEKTKENNKVKKNNNMMLYVVIAVVVIIVIALAIFLFQSSSKSNYDKMKVLEKYSWNDGIHERILTLGDKDKFIYEEKSADGSQHDKYYGTYKKENEEIKVEVKSSSTSKTETPALSFRFENDTVVYTDPEGNAYVFSRIANDNETSTPPPTENTGNVEENTNNGENVEGGDVTTPTEDNTVPTDTQENQGNTENQNNEAQ